MPNYNTTLQTNNSSLEEIITQLNNMPDAGEGGLDTSDATATSGDILNGKTAYVKGEKITGNIAMAEQATPAITINSSTGLITATATQTAGYVTAGTKSGTKQLAFKAATTITPGTTNQTAVAANTYVGGAITVKGDANLVASNIVSGKSIFGVVGTASAGGSGGGDTSMEDDLITKTLTTYTNDRVAMVGEYAFFGCTSLMSVSLPKVTRISSYAFQNCSSLANVSFPEVTSVGSHAFQHCSSLTSISFSKITSIADYAFQNCTSLTNVSFSKATIVNPFAFQNCTSLTNVSFPEVSVIARYAFSKCTSLMSVSFPKVTRISSYAFQNCTKLISIYLGASTLCTLSNSNVFVNTGITSTTGSIFVPASLLASYKAATNWTYFSNRIFSYAF